MIWYSVLTRERVKLEHAITYFFATCPHSIVNLLLISGHVLLKNKQKINVDRQMTIKQHNIVSLNFHTDKHVSPLLVNSEPCRRFVLGVSGLPGNWLTLVQVCSTALGSLLWINPQIQSKTGDMITLLCIIWNFLPDR